MNLKVISVVILLICNVQCIEVGTNLEISPTGNFMLNTSLNNLVVELRKFGTWYQNNYLLSQTINSTYAALVYVNNQLSAYNNAILGTNNTVNGSNNLIVGSYNSITGNNNFVFTSNYSGSAEGDLIIESWKVQLNKRNMVILFPSIVVSVLTADEATFYGGYVKNFQPLTTNALCLINNILQTTLSGAGTGAGNTAVQTSALPSSVSLLPTILTPLLGSTSGQTTSNLRTETAPTSTNQPSLISLSLPLLNNF